MHCKYFTVCEGPGHAHSYPICSKLVSVWSLLCMCLFLPLVHAHGVKQSVCMSVIVVVVVVLLSSAQKLPNLEI